MVKTRPDYGAAKTLAKRMIICNGIAQLAFALASLYKCKATQDESYIDTLVLYAWNPAPARRELMLQFAISTWKWNQIEFFSLGDNDSNQQMQKRLSNLIAAPAKVVEIWLCMPKGLIEQAAMRLCKHANLVLYEDGLNTYTEFHDAKSLLLHPKRAFVYFAMRLTRGLSKLGISQPCRTWPWRPLHCSHLLMAETLQIAARYRDGIVHKTEAMYFHSVIENCEAAMKVESVAIAHPHETVVFLGEGYYLWNVMPWEIEHHIYKTIIQSIIDRGYRVYWKEHPKSTHHFGKSLQDAFGKSRLAYDAGDNFWPIEFLIGKITPAACVSVLSTALFTLPLLYGFRTFHASRYFKKYLTHGEKLAMKLVTEKIADLEELEPIRSQFGEISQKTFFLQQD